MDIRHIAVSESSSLFAVAAFERDVQVWDYSKRQKVAELKTILDFGGSRLALYSGNRPLLIAGAYNRYGVRAYDLSLPGEEAWERRDLKKPQYIAASERLGLVTCGFSSAAMHIIDASTGHSMGKLRGALTCYFGPRDDEIILSQGFGRIWSAGLASRRTICRFPVRRGALDIAQSADAVLISDFGTLDDSAKPMTQIAPARLLCYSRDARLLWEADAAPLAHFLSVAWCPELHLWFAVEWPYARGGPMKLKAFTEEGKPVHEAVIGVCSDTAFFLQGQCLITSAGEVLELPSLNVLWRFGD